LQQHSDAHAERLAEIQGLADSEPIPAARWVSPRDLKPIELPPDPTALVGKYYRDIVSAYRGDLKGAALAALTADDPLLAQRLRSSGPSDRAIHRLLTRLREADHRKLASTGMLALHPATLTKAQRALLEPVIQASNEQARQGGAMFDPYSLFPQSGTRFGFALVEVPDVERPALIWWMLSPASPNPTWVTLANQAATRAPGYQRAYFAALADQ
jgi:hypothetical protein